ncbi:diguanylate cyclase (GGDEF) domain-containing protein [Rhizobium sp. NFR07]|uniref:GGDEF domain-containing response regulator n=1 Tax=Rhizobium sp. NFR07 TaxID=1566262 RepID=UPI0008EA7AE2|nr:PleD family two-component system response regulator [Rhizobium sp. NFR07]SFB45716.1 diguanylate cyclase (GGDEF) domain-containing protein [Rhizobium sp. NFR07]
MTVGRDNLLMADGPGNRHANEILLIEDSVALSTLLTQRLEEETGAAVTRCGSMAAARGKLQERSFMLALSGLNLPDAPNGEILNLLDEAGVATIVFTARFDVNAREKYAEKKIIDYIVKDGSRTVDTVVNTVRRFCTNNAYRILVVDDVRTARSGLTDILNRQNFQVLEAHSGRQALEILAGDDTIELVITDYHMPDMDGYELTRRIRETRGSEEIRIIGVSSSSDRLLSASFLKAGASDFIYRPFVPEELQCRIDNNIETLTQLKHLRRLAERDHLTGLANRRHFFDRMRNLGADALSGSIALLDIDHFKNVNDSYGHDVGDRVLVTLATVMEKMCAAGRHIPARLGGEEFAIFLNKADAFQSHSFCEELRRAIEEANVPTGNSKISVTVSIGVVEIEPGETFSNQMNAADQLLYLAKANGRNRVYSSLTLPEAMRSAAPSV